MLALYGSLDTPQNAHAQSEQLFNPLGTTNSLESTVAMDDLIIGIQHSQPTVLGQAITFSATLNITDTTGLSFSWQFGDSQTANGRGVAHTYNRAGHYSVRLFVTSSTQRKEAEKSIQIKPLVTPTQSPPPIPEITLTDDDPNHLEAQKPINFLGTVSEGTGVAYSWNFGDNSPPVAGSAVVHSYEEPGTYTIQLVATNSAGSKSGYKTVTIKDAPPVDLTFSYSPNPFTVGEFVTFTATQKRGTRLNYEWQFSDGTAPQVGKVIRHSFSGVGNYEVRVKAQNGAGEAEYSKLVIARALPPKFINIIEDSPKNPNEPITFFVSANSDAPINLYYEWGDRAKLTKKLSTPTDSLYRDEQSHAYPEDGKYPVILSVYNEFGSDQKEMIAYVGIDRPLQTVIRYDHPKRILPQQSAKFSIVEDMGALNCQWIFSDQRARNSEDRLIQRPGEEVNHSFGRSGAFVVTIECKSADGTVVKVSDFVIFVESVSFIPMINQETVARGGGDARQPVATPTNTPTNTPVSPNTVVTTATPIPTTTPTPQSTPTPTETALPPTATATASPSATPSLPATVTSTPTFIATAPTVTPTPTDPLGGTIPQR